MSKKQMAVPISIEIVLVSTKVVAPVPPKMAMPVSTEVAMPVSTEMAVAVATEAVPVSTKMALPVSTTKPAQPADPPQLALLPSPGAHS